MASQGRRQGGGFSWGKNEEEEERQSGARENDKGSPEAVDPAPIGRRSPVQRPASKFTLALSGSARAGKEQAAELAQTPVEKERVEDAARTAWQAHNAEIQGLAKAGLIHFIEDVLVNAVALAEQYTKVALTTGLAAGALAPVLDRGEEGVAWLAGNQYEALAAWAEEDVRKGAAATEADPVAARAIRLDSYIHGRVEIDENDVRLRGAHPKAGEETVRLLRSLNLSGALRAALQGEERQKERLLRNLRMDLAQLADRQYANTYLLNYTMQEVVMQSFMLLAAEFEEGSTSMSPELGEVNQLLHNYVDRDINIYIGKIDTGGGFLNLGSIRTEGGAIYGRDQQVGFTCP